ncbi:DnaJ domain-containing protein [Loa loa]|uniref:DnaJ domain-containing protein n=1 Tax=Loa loa TaxID=7209 RepID=A0A1I7VH88_LOALO|nr:DnaJ domain-containing protein [Loa loa]EFO20225.1 DnaJ domain-containing protein [Loa loa]
MVPLVLLIICTVIHAELLDGLYCGIESCYEVLNIDRSEFNKNVLGRTYRKLAARYHPDKVANAKKKEAEENFRKIATAYETLKDDETRADYDYYLDHPEQRAYNYYQYYRRRMAPKVDARIVVLVTLILISAFQFLSAAQKHKEALDYAVKQEKYRNAAKEIAKERGISLEGDSRNKKLRKEYAEQVLRQIIEENVDIRGGYKKPSIYNTLLWTIIVLPYTIYRYAAWNFSWFIKYHLKKEDYDEDAKTYLIQKNLNLSEEQFANFSDSERLSLFKNELWDRVKFAEWKAAKEDEQKERLAASGRYKRYRRYMKNQQGLPLSFME